MSIPRTSRLSSGLNSADGCCRAGSFAVIFHHVHVPNFHLLVLSFAADASTVFHLYIGLLSAEVSTRSILPSSLCPFSLNEGFENIVNADMSRVAIYQMAETYKAYPMECELYVVLKSKHNRQLKYLRTR